MKRRRGNSETPQLDVSVGWTRQTGFRKIPILIDAKSGYARAGDCHDFPPDADPRSAGRADRPAFRGLISTPRGSKSRRLLLAHRPRP